MTLEELQKEERGLRTLIAQNIEKQKEIKEKEFVKLYGIEIGDKVLYQNSEYVVSGFKHRHMIIIDIVARKILKGGIISKFNTNIYHYSSVVKITQKGFMKPEDFK